MRHSNNTVLVSEIELNKQMVKNIEKALKYPKKYLSLINGRFSIEDLKAQLSLAKDFLRSCAI